MKPWFEAHAEPTLDEVRETFCRRGQQYGDSWGTCQFLAMRATASRMGLKLTVDQCRRLAAAQMVDLKYARLLGGYKDDTLVDLVAYAAAHREAERGMNETD